MQLGLLRLVTCADEDEMGEVKWGELAIRISLRIRDEAPRFS